jgi:hypothetical protein
MSDTTETPFKTRCAILGTLWLEYSTDEDLEDFVSYNDLGLPIAFAIAEDIVETNPVAEGYINETWNLLLAALEIEDIGFSKLDDLFAFSEEV